MPIEAMRQSIRAILDAPACSAEFLFLFRTPDGPVVRRMDMDQDAQQELGIAFMLELRTRVIEDEALSLQNLSSADDRANVVYRYDLDEIPANLLASQVAISDPALTISNDDLSGLSAILIVIGNHERQMLLYKHQYPVALMRVASGFSLKRRRGGSRFEKLDGDILRINQKFEFFLINNTFYVLDIKTLERFHGFEQAVKNMANQSIEAIAGSRLIANSDIFATRLNELSFSRKLIRAAKDSPVLNRIPNDRVIEFVSRHPKLSKKISLSEDGTQLQLDTKVSQDLFLKLLNDDYLRSLLTETEYESLAKDSIVVVATAT